MIRNCSVPFIAYDGEEPIFLGSYYYGAAVVDGGAILASAGLNLPMIRPDRFRALLRDLTADDRFLLECRIS